MHQALVLDRSVGRPASLRFDAWVEDRPGDPHGPVWIPCGVALAMGTVELGMTLATPPRPHAHRNAPKVVRLTSLIALVNDVPVDLKNPAERRRVGLAAHETFPLRIRLLVEPPFSPIGLNPLDRTLPLAKGVWSRALQPVDLAEDVDRLAPMGW